MTPLEEHRPKVLEEFIGQRKQIISLRSYMDGNIDVDATLLVGPPGLGKTTLAHIIAKEYNLDPLEINASDERRQKDTVSTRKAANTLGLGGRRKLLIVDECDGAGEKFLKSILDIRARKVFCANDVDAIPWRLKRRFHIVTFTNPGAWAFKELMKRIKPDAEDPPYDLFQSFRDVINWVEGGEPQCEVTLTDDQLMLESFAGKRPALDRNQIMELMRWCSINGTDSELLSHCAHLVWTDQLQRCAAILQSIYLNNPKRPARWYPKKERQPGRIVLLGFAEVPA